MKKPLIFILLFAALTACGPNNVNTPTFTQVPPTASPTPSETPPTAIPEKSYETRDASGKLIAIEDIYGNSIKATHEVKVASATAGDWTGVNERLGADFAINADGKIPDVDGITVDKENGKVAFSYDGQHTENYNIVNMKTQVIEGKTRIMIGSYWWNAEAKAWKAFYLNFPMSESPKDELGWVTEADISNGNQLRWDQRRLEDLAAKEGKTVEVYMKDLFAKAIRPIGYGAEVVNRPDVGGLVNEAALFFSSPNYDVGPRTMKSITKDQWPVRALGTSYLIGAKAVIFSLLFLNND
ncbi:MAG: hypothetical protein MUO77_20560, partial [Anaerolineales bacterium]|nr:hypothetical protein [Anaerolineales bacterium]